MKRSSIPTLSSKQINCIHTYVHIIKIGQSSKWMSTVYIVGVVGGGFKDYGRVIDKNVGSLKLV